MEHETVEAPPARALRARARLVVALVAAWLWALSVGLPAVEVGLGGWARGALALVFPLVVAAALVLEVLPVEDVSRGPTSTGRVVEVLLFALAPASLAGALASRSELTAREVMGPLHLTLLVVASASYLAAVGWLSSVRADRRTGRAQPLPPSSLASDAGWARAVRVALVSLAVLASIALVAVAPVWTGHAARTSRFGLDGADTAALLATVVGLALAVAALGGVVAPALRAPASAPALPRSRGLAWIGLALASLLAWWLLERT